MGLISSLPKVHSQIFSKSRVDDILGKPALIVCADARHDTHPFLTPPGVDPGAVAHHSRERGTSDRR